MERVVITSCANCGAPVDSQSGTECKYCKAPIIIKTLADLAKIPKDKRPAYMSHYKEALEGNTGHVPLSIALVLCHIGAQNFTIADRLLNKLIDDDCQDPNIFYYKAICLLEGKRPRTLNYDQIDEVRAQLRSANSMGSGVGTYYVFMAILRLDYFDRYGFNHNCGEDAKTLCSIANSHGVSEDEVRELLDVTQITSDVSNILDEYLLVK